MKTMRKPILSLFLVIILLVIGFNAGYLFGQSPWAPVDLFAAGQGLLPGLSGGAPLSQDREAMEPFWEVWDLVHARFYEQPIDDTLLVEGAIDGMLATLGDEHTRYLAPAEEIASQERMDGEFQGIGVVVEAVDGNLTVVSPIEGSPAFEAGLQPGDILRAADGVDLTGMDVGEAAALIRGPVGTTLQLVIERDGEPFTIDIARAVINIPSVEGEMLENNIAYVRINQFMRTTEEELEPVLQTLLASNPAGLILDLRHNPGGLLDQVTDVADQFLSDGVILKEEFGDGEQRIYDSTADGLAEEVPLVVLIDEGSASASEVLAGAIQDRGRGVLVGATSFGKGTVQAVHSLSNGGGLRLTVARWLTPDENWVHEQGLQPDVVVMLPEAEELTTGDATAADPQLEAAIQYLLGRTTLNTTQD
jgi:carboxyl-terminal processing protease